MYAVRQQRVRAGAARDVLVAVFPLACGQLLCLQLQDEGDLRRGGVYLLERDDPALPAAAPRFDELFADAAAKLQAAPALHPELIALLERARDAARATRPRLDPDALSALLAVLEAAAELRRTHAPLPGLPLEALVGSLLLIFVSEEERYPRPKYRGGDVLMERFLEMVGR